MHISSSTLASAAFRPSKLKASTTRSRVNCSSGIQAIVPNDLPISQCVSNTAFPATQRLDAEFLCIFFPDQITSSGLCHQVCQSSLRSPLAPLGCPLRLSPLIPLPCL